MQIISRTISILFLAALGCASTLLIGSCAGTPCHLEEGCIYSCTTDDDCGEDLAPLCRPEIQTGMPHCTRSCTDSSGCVCGCEQSPDQGFCTLLPLDGGPSPQMLVRTAVCRTDKPSIAVMCDAVVEALSRCCPITVKEIDACATYEQAYPACTAELDALFFCAYRLKSLCEGAGVYAEGACSAEAAALEQCTSKPWDRLSHEVCSAP